MSRPRVLLAWELGAGFGHLAPLRAIGRSLAARGHDCRFALRELHSAEAMGFAQIGPLLAAPLSLGKTRHPVRVQTSYATLLHQCGFDHVDALAGRLRAWRQLLIDHRSEALVVDHAPTALLAAYSLGIPTAATGTGFTVPPAQNPLPAFPGLPASTALLAGNEAQVLSVINAALERFSAAPLRELRQLFAGVHLGLKTYPELDHYGLSRGDDCIGLPDFSSGLRVDWHPGSEPKLVAYLRPFRGLDALLDALARLPAQVLVRIAEQPASALARFQRPGLVVVEQDIWLRQAAERCDAFVNYGAHGATTEMLLAGKPCLLLPYTTEQRLLAGRAAALGAALVLDERQRQEPAAALRQLLDDVRLRSAAGDFAQRYAGQDRSRIIDDWLDRWPVLLAS